MQAGAGLSVHTGGGLGAWATPVRVPRSRPRARPSGGGNGARRSLVIALSLLLATALGLLVWGAMLTRAIYVDAEALAEEGTAATATANSNARAIDAALLASPSEHSALQRAESGTGTGAVALNGREHERETGQDASNLRVQPKIDPPMPPREPEPEPAKVLPVPATSAPAAVVPKPKATAPRAPRRVSRRPNAAKPWTGALDCHEPMRRLAASLAPDTLPVDPKSVALLSVFIGNALKFHAPSSRNRKEYADAHGYQYVEVTAKNKSDPPEASDPRLRLPADWAQPNEMWGKLHAIDAIARQLPEVRFVLWVDADITLTNMGVDLGFLIAQDKSIVTSGDFNGINTGVFLLRADEWSRGFLRRVFRVDPKPWKFWPGEQGSIYITMVDGDAESKAHEHWVQFMTREVRPPGHCQQRDVDRHLARLLAAGDAHLAAMPAHVLWLPMCVAGSNKDTWTRGMFNMHPAGYKFDQKVRIIAASERNDVVRDGSCTTTVMLANSDGTTVDVTMPAHQPGDFA